MDPKKWLMIFFWLAVTGGLVLLGSKAIGTSLKKV